MTQAGNGRKQSASKIFQEHSQLLYGHVRLQPSQKIGQRTEKSEDKTKAHCQNRTRTIFTKHHGPRLPSEQVLLCVPTERSGEEETGPRLLLLCQTPERGSSPLRLHRGIRKNAAAPGAQICAGPHQTRHNQIGLLSSGQSLVGLGCPESRRSRRTVTQKTI